MHKEELNEYNGIKIGDTIKIINDLCFDSYESWLDTYGFDKTIWKKHGRSNRGALCKVLGIGTHLRRDEGAGVNGDFQHILFYVGNEKQTWIMRDDGIELVPETKNYCTRKGNKTIFYIIE